MEAEGVGAGQRLAPALARLAAAAEVEEGGGLGAGELDPQLGGGAVLGRPVVGISTPGSAVAQLFETVAVALQRRLVVAEALVQAAATQPQVGAEGGLGQAALRGFLEQPVVDGAGGDEAAEAALRLGLAGGGLDREVGLAGFARHLGDAAVELRRLAVGVDLGRRRRGAPQVGQRRGAFAGLPGVVGDGGRPLAALLAARRRVLDQTLGAPAVQLAAPLAVEAGVEAGGEAAARQGVERAVGLAQALEVALLDQRRQVGVGRQRVAADQRRRLGEAERLADHRRRLQHPARRGAQPFEALLRELLGAAGGVGPAVESGEGELPVAVAVAQHPLAHQVAQQLLDLPRRAAGALVDRLVDPVEATGTAAGTEAGAEAGVDQLRRLRAVEGGEADGVRSGPLVAVVQRLPGRRRAVRLTAGQHQHRQVGDLAGEEGEELVTRLAGAVHVVEQQDERRRPVAAVAAGLLLAAQGGGDLAVDAEALAAARLVRRRPRRRRHLDAEPLQRFEHRRQRRAGGGGTADPHPRPVEGGEDAQLAQHAALAHPLAALHRHHPAVAGGGGGELVAQPRHHLVAPHQPARQQGAAEGQLRRVDPPPRRLAELDQQLAGAGEALAGIALHQAAQHLGQGRRHVGAQALRVRALGGEVELQRAPAVARRRQGAGGQLEEGEAQRVEVGPLVVGVLQDDLRRGVGEGAADAPVEAAPHHLGEAEVEDLEARAALPRRHLGQPQVRRLDVVVDDALPVDVGEAGGGLDGDVVHRVPVRLRRAVRRRRQQLADAARRQQLHGEEGEAARQRAAVVDLDDVGVARFGEQAHLVAEARQLLGVARMERHLEGEGGVAVGAGAHAIDGGQRGARDLRFHHHVAEVLVEARQVRTRRVGRGGREGRVGLAHRWVRAPARGHGAGPGRRR